MISQRNPLRVWSLFFYSDLGTVCSEVRGMLRCSLHPITPDYHQRLRYRMRMRRLFSRRVSNKYVFVLCPPFCGSTLLAEILDTSKNVSCNNPRGTREGQKLPRVRDIMYDSRNRWEADAVFPWPLIQKEWLKYWDISRPILLEKSPPNLIRAVVIESYFQPAYFVCMVRNPYAHCEGLIRRNNRKPDEAAAFTVKCLMYQKANIEALSRVLFFTYEELASDSDGVRERLIEFLPELADISVEGVFHSHNQRRRNLSITNLNKEKIERLTPGQMSEITRVLSVERDILEYFGYSTMDAHAGNPLR